MDTATTPSVQYTYEDGAATGSDVARYVRLSQVTYPGNSRAIAYDYSGAVDEIMSRLTRINDGANPLAEYTYLGAGTIASEEYPEAGITLDYDPAGDGSFTGLDRFGRVQEQLWQDSQSATVDGYRYAYDLAGNRTSRENLTANAVDHALGEMYGYNDLNALTSTQRGYWNNGVFQADQNGLAQSWDLDALGNWSEFDDGQTIETRTANAANEISSINDVPTTDSYDAAGNMIVVPDPLHPGSNLHCTFDAWNRLVEVRDDNDDLVAQYRYDGRGRRIEKFTAFSGEPLAANHVTHYYLSGQQVIETRSGSPAYDPGVLAPEYQYVWSQRYVDALIVRDDLSVGATYDRLYYLDDANFNVTAVVGCADEEWQVVERYAYSAYGKAEVYDGDWERVTNDVSAVGNTVLYTGQDLDPETGLYFYNARYYSAELGRFVGRDPLEADQNLYRYCGNNPVLLVDPTGLLTWKIREDTCTVTMFVKVQLIFKNNNGNTWTPARKAAFETAFKRAIERVYDNPANIRIHPPMSSVWRGYYSTCCPCYQKGFTPHLVISFTPRDARSVSEDWEVDVKANPSGAFIQSSNLGSWGYLDEADVNPVLKTGAAAGHLQIPAAHEFGHFLGLNHPGAGLEGGLFSSSQLSAGANAYTHVGQDRAGNDVNGTVDLMGAGDTLRPFYFQKWADELNRTYHNCTYKPKG